MESAPDPLLDEEEALSALNAPKAAKGKAAAASKGTPVPEDVKSWMQSLGGSTPVKFYLFRLEPKRYGNEITEGMVCLFEEPITLEEIKDLYGGGKYSMKMQTPDAHGRWAWRESKVFVIQGPPKIAAVQGGVVSGGGSGGGGGHGNENPYLARRALDMTERSAEKDREKAERLEAELRNRNNNNSLDMNAIAALFDRFAGKGDETSKIFGRYLETDTDRTAKMREMHESELRAMRSARDESEKQLRQSHADDMKRQADTYQRQIDALERKHDQFVALMSSSGEGRIASLTSSYEGRLESLKTSFEAQRIPLESEIARLRSDNEALKKEVAELRAKKDKPVTEQLADIAQLKTTMEDLGFGGDKDEEEGGVFDKIAGVVGPLLEGVGARIAHGSPEQQAAAQQQVIMAQAKARTEIVAAHQAAAAPPAPAQPTQQPIDPRVVQNVVQFLEAAVSTNKTPEDVVQTAMSVGVPRAALRQIAALDVDQFLEMAKVQDGSILQAQAGRSFLRKVMKLIRGDGA